MDYFAPKPRSADSEPHARLWRFFTIVLILVIVALLVALLLPIWVRRGVD